MNGDLRECPATCHIYHLVTGIAYFVLGVFLAKAGLYPWEDWEFFAIVIVITIIVHADRRIA